MLWIRSQNGTALINATEIKVKDVKVYANATLMGMYSTRERAMEVISAIHGSISNGTRTDSMQGYVRTTKDRVFNMPKE